MDMVTLNGKIYLKVSKAADEVGYTPDYVGQLCRKGSIDAVVLGKTWYVREDSLLQHKASKVRVNTATTRRDIQKQQEEKQEQERGPRPSPMALHTGMATISEYRKRLLATNIRYSPDSHDLLPSPLVSVPAYTDRPAEERISAYPDEENGQTRQSFSEDNEGEVLTVSEDEPEEEVEQEESEESEESEETETEEADDDGAEEDEEYGDDREQDIQENESEIEEKPQERPVFIHKVGSSRARAGVSAARIVPRGMDIRAPREEKRAAPREIEAYSSDEMEEEWVEKQERKTPRRVVGSYRSLLPVVCLLLLLFVLANIGLESTWSYADDFGSKKAEIETTYNLASVGSITEAIREIKF